MQPSPWAENACGAAATAFFLDRWSDAVAAGAAPNHGDERRHDSLNSAENCPGHGAHFTFFLFDQT